MRTVRVTLVVPGTVPVVERSWYDTSRWASWVDGLDRVLAIDGDWPGIGSTVTWESGPAGRGHVTERVISHAALAGQTVEVDDVSIRGRQSVAFAALADGVQIELTLEYALKRRSPVSPIVDALFIKRAMAASLNVSLAHFAVELRAARRGGRPAPGDD